MSRNRTFLQCLLIIVFFIPLTSCQSKQESNLNKEPENTPGQEIEEVEETVDVKPYGSATLSKDEIIIRADYILGEFSTDFSRSSESRKRNIKNAASKINEYVVYPQQEFSTCSLLVPFTKENGYDNGKMYVEGRVVDGIGGGVCQVSTTLYNAVLEAGLTVLERHPHSMAVSYVEIGRDAAIAETSKDFRFLNQLEVPIVIEAVVTPYDQLICRIRSIYQKKDTDTVITYETKILEEIPPKAPVISYDETKPKDYVLITQAAHIGYRVELYRVTTVDGIVTERVRVSYSEYQPSPQYMVIGKK